MSKQTEISEVEAKMENIEKMLGDLWFRDRKEDEFDRKVLSVILYFSRTEDKYTFPTIEQFILAELVSATIEHLTGKRRKVSYRSLCENFERKAWESLLKTVAGSRPKISEAVQWSILRLTEHRMVNPSGPDRPYPSPEIYLAFKGFGGIGGICEGFMKSTFSFSERTRQRIEKETLPSLSESTKKDCKTIGKKMRKYIEQDLKYIEEHYYW